MKEEIEQKNQRIIASVVANLALSGIGVTEEDIQRMERVLNRESTVEEEIAKIVNKYKTMEI